MIYDDATDAAAALCHMLDATFFRLPPYAAMPAADAIMPILPPPLFTPHADTPLRHYADAMLPCH